MPDKAILHRPENKGDNVDYYSLKEGTHDPSLNHNINVLILVDKDFIIYLDENYYVQWETSEQYDASGWPVGYGEVFNKIAMLETKSDYLLTENQIPSFRRLLGEALARIIEGKSFEEANEFLKQAETFLYERSIEKAKIWYILSSAITSTFFILVGILLWIFKENVETAIGTDFYGVLYLSMFGSLGAFSSIISRTNKMKLEPAAGIYTHVIDATTKIVGGIIGAFIVIIGIKSNLLSAIITNHDMSWWLLIFFAIIAGASERFVPDIIKKYEVIPDKEENQQTT